MLKEDVLGKAVATGRLGLLGGGSDKLCPFALGLRPPLPPLSFPETFLRVEETSLVQGKKTSREILVQRIE